MLNYQHCQQDQKQSYKHSDFVKCRDIADFAKIYNFVDKSGELLGRNKVFAVLKSIGILDKDNIPYQSYRQYFKTLEKTYDNGEQEFKRILVFVTPEGQKYLANRINNFIDALPERKLTVKKILSYRGKRVC